jgi:hypothetical protein
MANIKLKDLLNEQSALKQPPISQVGDNTRTVIPKQAVNTVSSNMFRGSAEYKEQQKAYVIAKKIYDAKGIFLDDENAAVKAIQQIKDSTQFNLVQKELQKLTRGRGIGQYVTSFIGHLEDVDTKGLGVHVTGKFEGQRTGPLLDNIISHLERIKADSKTINLFQSYRSKLTNQFFKNIWDMPETMHMVNTVGSVVSLLFGPIGLALSTAYSLTDAQQYYEEGNDYEAGLALVFALIPGGAKVGKGLIRKIVTKSGVLTKAERAVLMYATKNKALIQNKIGNLIKSGIESGKLNPYAFNAPKWLTNVDKGTFKLAYGATKYIVAPIAAYDVAYNKLNPPMSEDEFNSIMYAELNSELNRELNNIK